MVFQPGPTTDPLPLLSTIQNPHQPTKARPAQPVSSALHVQFEINYKFSTPFPGHERTSSRVSLYLLYIGQTRLDTPKMTNALSSQACQRVCFLGENVCQQRKTRVQSGVGVIF